MLSKAFNHWIFFVFHANAETIRSTSAKREIEDQKFNIDFQSKNQSLRGPDSFSINSRATRDIVEKSANVPDLGVLGVPASTCADSNFVHCVDGMAGTETCAQACGGLCCTGANACQDTTANICKDGSSCKGDDSCRSLKAEMIVNSCKGGDFISPPCRGLNANRVIDSCHGQSVCRSASIGNARNSCLGTESCKLFGGGGLVRIAEDSCHGEFACSKAFRQSSVVNNILLSSCNNDLACYETSSGSYGSVKKIQDCCNENAECSDRKTLDDLPQDCRNKS